MFISTLSAKRPKLKRHAKPYCQCWNKRRPVAWKRLNECSCGEDNDGKFYSFFCIFLIVIIIIRDVSAVLMIINS